MTKETKWFERGHQLLLLLVYTAAFAIPFNITITNITLIAAAVLAMILFWGERGATLGSLPLIIFPLFLLSLVISQDTRRAFQFLDIGFSFLYIPIIFFFGSKIFTSKVTDNILKIFIAGILTFCLYRYVGIACAHEQFFPTDPARDYTYHEPFSRYAFAGSYPVYISIFILFAVVIVFEKFTQNTGVIIITIVLSAFFLIILSSKNQIVVYFVIISLLIWRRIKAKIWIKSMAVVGVLSIMVFFGLRDGQIRYRFVHEISNAESDRFILWSSAWQISVQKFLTGVGTGDRSRALQEQLSISHPQLATRYNSAHNQFLDFLLTFGIIGLVCFLLVLFVPFLLRVDMVFLLLVVITAAGCITESFLFRQKGLSFFLLFYGVLGAPYSLSRPREI